MAIPFYRQKTAWTCGPDAMRMVLESLGIKRSEKDLANVLKARRVRGTTHKKMVLLAEKMKLDYIVKRNAAVSDLKNLKKQGYRIIVCFLVPDEKEHYCAGHYAVVRKLDSKNIYLLDPWYGPRHRYKLSFFRRIWRCSPQFEHERGWLMAIKK